MKRTFSGYEELRTFLQSWGNWNGPDEYYDPAGLFHLILAAVDNLSKNANESDLEEFGGVITDEQRAFLRQVVESTPREVDEDEFWSD